MNFKGGQGKTSIALNLAFTFDYGIVANETYTVLTNYLDEAHLLIANEIYFIAKNFCDGYSKPALNAPCITSSSPFEILSAPSL